MRVLSVSSLKGGVGKSTIAQNLAVMFAYAGWKVTIVDADTNQSCIKWSSLRSPQLPQIPVFGLPDGAALVPNVNALKASNDIVIIDGTPSLSKLQSKIIMAANFVLIPILPGALDLWATEKFLDHYDSACEQRGMKIPAAFMINRNKKTKTASQVSDILSASNIPLLKSSLNDRIIYNNAVIKGTGVYEQKDLKAKAELAKFFNELNEML